MTAIPEPLIQLLTRACLGVILFGLATVSMAQAPIIQPGAPGEPPRELSADEAIKIANTSYSPDDVMFMQDMIPHHNQAMQMAELVSDRTNLVLEEESERLHKVELHLVR